MPKDDYVARYLSWQSARTVSERPWVRVPVGPRFFPARDSNPGPLAIHETTELLSQWPTFDIFFPESARNNGGTTRHAPFDERCPSREPTLAAKCHREGKSWPDRDSNPGPLTYRASTLPTDLPSHMVVL